MKALLVKQNNGSLSLLRYEPIIEKVAGTDHSDVYVRPGDPIGWRNVCQVIACKILGTDGLDLHEVGDSCEIELFAIPRKNMTRELRKLITQAQAKKGGSENV